MKHVNVAFDLLSWKKHCFLKILVFIGEQTLSRLHDQKAAASKSPESARWHKVPARLKTRCLYQTTVRDGWQQLLHGDNENLHLVHLPNARKV